MAQLFVPDQRCCHVPGASFKQLVNQLFHAAAPQFFLSDQGTVIIDFLLFLRHSLFLAQAAVFFRDIQYIYSVLTTAWMYATPLFYPSSLLSEGMQRAVYLCNPMYHYVTQFRTLVLERTLPQAGSVLYGSFLAALFLVLGTWAFLRTQDRFILYI